MVLSIFFVDLYFSLWFIGVLADITEVQQECSAEFEFNDSENDDSTVHKISTKALISLVVLASCDLVELF